MRRILSALHGAFDPTTRQHSDGLFPRAVWTPPVHIQAPREVVWEVLTGFEQYPEWCPFTRAVHTDGGMGAAVVQHLRWDDSLGEPTQTMTEEMTIWERGVAMGWALNWGVLLTAERFHYLEQIYDGSTLYWTGDRWTGLLAPLVHRLYGARTLRGFIAAGRALKVRIEGRFSRGRLQA